MFLMRTTAVWDQTYSFIEVFRAAWEETLNRFVQMISILASGNAVRQQTVGEASGIKRFIISVVYAVYSMANATTVPVLLIWVFIAPMIYGLAKKSELDFSHPVWAMVLLFGLYA